MKLTLALQEEINSGKFKSESNFIMKKAIRMLKDAESHLSVQQIVTGMCEAMYSFESYRPNYGGKVSELIKKECNATTLRLFQDFSPHTKELILKSTNGKQVEHVVKPAADSVKFRADQLRLTGRGMSFFQPAKHLKSSIDPYANEAQVNLSTMINSSFGQSVKKSLKR